MKNSSIMARGLLIATALLGTALCAGAQTRPITFGSPLRPNTLFAYKYVERVTELVDVGGQRIDSTQRLVTYYITEHEFPAPEGRGLLSIEVNVDSMELDEGGMMGHVYFNTQQLELAQDRKIVAHRDVFAPSLLVNRMVTFVITPYGQVLRVESKKRDEALKDVAEANLDAFTNERIRQVLTDQYLASIMLPWRGIAPLGQKVAFDKEIRIPFLTAFDRLSFSDTAGVRLTVGPDSAAALQFTAELDRPLNKLVTISAFEEPVKVDAAHATVGGSLKLAEDGIVTGGWTVMKGTILATRSGSRVTSTVTHEIYIESMGTSPVNGN